MEPRMGNTSERQSSKTNVLTRLNRIAELARQMPGTALTTLAHHIDKDFLREAWAQVRKDGATGIDEVTAAEYSANLEANLEELLGRFKSGTYYAPPGVLEDGRVTYPEDGTPQGGVISPLLANIYLHEVLDVWFEKEVKPRMKGRTRLIRYADDFVICFEREDDARKIAEVLPKRFEKYGLQLHPDKTRLIRYKRPPLSSDDKDDEPPKFDFLGFTHYWARSYRGYWVIKRRTIAKRLTRKIKEIWEWCREHRHDPVKEQRDRLASRLTGYYNYHGITSNFEAIAALYRETRKSWYYWLNRRSQRGLTLQKFHDLERLFPLPKPRLVHTTV